MKRHLLHIGLIFTVLSLFLFSCSSTKTEDDSSNDNVISEPSPNPNPDPDPAPNPGPDPDPDPDPDPGPGPDPDPIPQAVPCETGSFCIVTTTLANANLTAPYSQRLTVQGGTGIGYTWSISGGVLPDGLTLAGNNETLSWGTPVLSGNVNYESSGLAGEDLTEVSGLVVSGLNPGVLWVLDDSGGGSDIFAINESGTLLQKYTISGVSNRDWEDMAIGKGPDPAKEYLYIGDFGDNGASRGTYQIIRVEEPAVPSERAGTISLTGDVFYFRYPDGSKNCEAMVMDWEGEIIYLVEKTGGIGRVYKFPSKLDSLWDATHPVTLLLVSNVGIVSGQITGGGSSRDNERILLRQYGKVWEYARGYGSSFEDIFNEVPSEVNVGGAKDQQYETIAYSSRGTIFYTITEKNDGITIPIYKFVTNPGFDYTEISGAASSAGRYAFSVRVKDSAGDITAREFVITVE